MVKSHFRHVRVGRRRVPPGSLLFPPRLAPTSFFFQRELPRHLRGLISFCQTSIYHTVTNSDIYNPRSHPMTSEVFPFFFFLFLELRRYLRGRVGVERAAYATLIFPLVALGISTIFEGYQWSSYAVIGIVLILGGNLLILKRTI